MAKLEDRLDKMLPRTLSPRHNNKCKAALKSAHEKFVSKLPGPVQQLPRLKATAGCVWYTGVLFAFAMLLAFAIKSNREVRYISLDAGHGCESIKQHISQTFLLDTSGYWSSSIRYNPLAGIVTLRMTEFQASEEDYRGTWAPAIRDKLYALNHYWSENLFATNILNMLTNSYTVIDESVNMGINTFVDYLFDQESIYGYLNYLPSSRRRRLEVKAEEKRIEESVCGSEGCFSRTLKVNAAAVDSMVRAQVHAKVEEVKAKGGHKRLPFKPGAMHVATPSLRAAASAYTDRYTPAESSTGKGRFDESMRHLLRMKIDEEEARRKQPPNQETETESEAHVAAEPPTEEDVDIEDEDRMLASEAMHPRSTSNSTTTTTSYATSYDTSYGSTYTYNYDAYSCFNDYDWWYTCYGYATYDDLINAWGAAGSDQVATSSDASYAQTCNPGAADASSYVNQTVTASMNSYVLSVTIDSTADTDFSKFISKNTIASTSTSTDLSVDMRSYTLAAAVNQKVISLANLTYVKPIFKGSLLGYYFLDNPNYLGMPSIICNKTSTICNVIVGSGSMYPYFSHQQAVKWYDDTHVNPCNCSAPEKVRTGTTCNSFDFQLLFLYYTGGCFINKNIQKNFANVTVDNSFNMLIIYNSGSNQVVNNYYYEVSWANCPKYPTDLNVKKNPNPKDLKLKVPYSPNAKLTYAFRPPTDLIQEYYKCKYTIDKIVIESLSTAFANTSAVQAAWLPLLLYFVVLYIRKKYGVQVKTVTDDDVADMMHTMAMERIMAERAKAEAESKKTEEHEVDQRDLEGTVNPNHATAALA